MSGDRIGGAQAAPAPDVPRLLADRTGRGVKVYAGPRCEPEPLALERMVAVSRLPWVAEPVVALPDLHWKERLETPSSTAVATSTDIVLSFSSPSQNCGMSLMATPLQEGDLSERLLDHLMDRLKEQIPRRRRRPALSRGEVLEFCRKGAPAAARRYGLGPEACAAMEESGNTLAGEEPTLEELALVMDEHSVSAGRWSFAFIGGGNHFLEVQAVSEVIDRAACETMGLKRGQVVVMYHTGSERLGHDLGRLFAWRRKTDPRRRRRLFWRKVRMHLLRSPLHPSGLAASWRYHFRRADYAAVPAESAHGRRLLLALRAAANYGYANRAAVASLIQEGFRRAAGSAGMELRILADLSHNSIRRERVGGRELWVHRHNAARVVAPGALPEGHPYRALGQPVMIPGTNRTSSFLVVGAAGAAGSLFSIDHGAGRTVERFERAGLLSPRPGAATRKYTYDAASPEMLPHVSDEAVEEVVAVAAAARLARPAARLRPLAVLKA